MRNKFSIKLNFDRVVFLIALGLMGVFLFVAIMAPWLATDKPLFVRMGGEKYWPILSGQELDPTMIENAEQVVFAPVPFLPEGHTDLKERFKPPGSQTMISGFTFTHYLGTDRLGRDVAAGIIHGCRKSLWVGLITVLTAAAFGVLLGAVAGYWGNKLPVKLSWSQIPLLLILLYLIFLYKYTILSGWTIALAVIILCLIQVVLNRKHPARYALPFDLLLLKMIEVFQSIPALLILMVIAGLVESFTLLSLSLLMASLRWTSFARYTRAEVIKIKARDYITAAKVSGLEDHRIITHYIMPEAIGPLLVAFAFGVSSVILLESTLSFIGIGISLDQVTWGTLLRQSREAISAWWLAVFPGLCIMLLVFSLNLIGSQLKERFDPQD